MIGKIIYGTDPEYPQIADWCNENDCHIIEIEPDGKGRRFKVVKNEAPSAEQIKEARIEELKKLLLDSDYKAIKFAEGELSAKEYEPIKLQRRQWREEINSLL